MIVTLQHNDAFNKNLFEFYAYRPSKFLKLSFYVSWLLIYSCMWKFPFSKTFFIMLWFTIWVILQVTPSIDGGRNNLFALIGFVICIWLLRLMILWQSFNDCTNPYLFINNASLYYFLKSECFIGVLLHQVNSLQNYYPYKHD